MTGIVICILAMWLLGHGTPFSNESDAQRGLDFRGLGLAFLLLPITVAGIVNLRGRAIGEGAALLGLARQFGGSVGIAIAATELTQMTQFHRTHLASNLGDGTAALSERVGMISNGMMAQGMDAARAQAAALHLVDGQLTRQAYTLAVNNVYILTAGLFAVSFPVLFLMKRSKGGSGNLPAH